jgi:hypothetical protein
MHGVVFGIHMPAGDHEREFSGDADAGHLESGDASQRRRHRHQFTGGAPSFPMPAVRCLLPLIERRCECKTLAGSNRQPPERVSIVENKRSRAK